MKKSGCKVRGVKNYPTKVVSAHYRGGAFKSGAAQRDFSGFEPSNNRERRMQMQHQLRAGGSPEDYRSWLGRRPV